MRIRVRKATGWTTTPGVKFPRFSATKALNHEGWTVSHNRTGYGCGSMAVGVLSKEEATVAAKALSASGFDCARKPPYVVHEDLYIIQAIVAEAFE